MAGKKKNRMATCHPNRAHKAFGLCNSCARMKYLNEHREIELQKLKDRALRYKYNMTRDEFNARLESQGGVCAICGKRPATNVDHNHTTDQIGKLLCNWCNRDLSLFGDDPRLIRSALKYLETCYGS
jgi:hypothetical protein